MKHLTLIIAYLILATNIYAQACEPTVAYNFDGNTLDVSGNGNDAVAFAGATADAGYLAIGYNDDDRAELPAAVLDGVNDFTITFSFYLNTLNLSGAAPTNTLIAGASGSNESEFAISYQADIEAIVVALKGSGDIFPISLSAGNWYCLTVKRNGSLVTVYIDGIELSTIDMTSSTLDIEFLEIGQELDCETGCYATNQSLNGRIDNFKVYPCFETNSGCEPFIILCDTLLSYSFTNNILDESVFGNHGTINGTASVTSNILEIGYNNDDYIEVPNAAADGLVNFAISFNFYLNDLNNLGSSPTNAFIAGTDGTNMHELALSYEASSNAFEVAIHEVGGLIPASILPNIWYCVTFYRSNDSVWIELDGLELPTILSLPEGPLSITFLEIGQELDCAAGCFAENQSLNGKMDNLIIQGCAEEVVCGDVSVGIAANSTYEATIYPNPSSDFITIKTPIAFANTEISITNAMGQKEIPVIISNNGNAIHLDVSTLLPGIYIIQLTNTEFVMEGMISVLD